MSTETTTTRYTEKMWLYIPSLKRYFQLDAIQEIGSDKFGGFYIRSNNSREAVNEWEYKQILKLIPIHKLEEL